MTTAVIGGTGKTGARVASRLQTQHDDVRVVSRSSSGFDWDHRETWGAAVAGAERAYVTYSPDIGFPGAAETVASFVTQAVDAGCRRIVLLSGRGEPGAQHAEKLIADTGADLTVLRCAIFAQNFSESFLLPGVLSGELVLPAGTCGEPFVDADDVADVAVASLAEDRHIGATYELTGPELVTLADAADILSLRLGRGIGYVPVDVESYLAGLPDDVPSEIADLLGFLFDGHNAYVGDGVRTALGRAPRSFAQYVDTAAAAGGVVAVSAPGWAVAVGSAATIGSGLVGGVFFTFSGFVMPALRRLPSADGVRAMQAINRTATQPPLMIALFGTAALSIAAGVAAVRSMDESWARWALAAAIVYVVSGVVVTIAANVPLNDRLAAMDPTSAGAAWQQFLSGWTAWNHVRTVGCLASCALFVRALLAR